MTTREAELPGENRRGLPPLVLGAGDGRGFGGFTSPAKLALADGLDPPDDGFELRIHGVGGSSPEKILEQPETVQVGGDQTAQFIRRQAVSSRPAVQWPLEGYWWGGLTSRATTRAFWVLLLPLTLCNLASWMLPASGQPARRRRAAGTCLPPVMRWAGYALTLLLTASLATASMDVVGWQCATAAPRPPAGGHGQAAGCLPGWLHWAPASAGPRLALFALVPVLVVAVIGYACHRTLRAYERWQLPAGLPGGGRAAQPSVWPLTADGFWHGLRPVRRQQMLHLAGAAALVSLYLALVPAAPSGVHAAAVAAAVALLALPAATLALPGAGRPGVNPHTTTASTTKVTGFDRWCGALLVLSVTVLGVLVAARAWWQTATPASPAGLLPGDSGIWWGLTFTMGALVAATAVLAVLARDAKEAKLDRPFAAGFLAPLTLALACVTGGIFAASLNLLLPSLLTGPAFHGTGPAIRGLPAQYPLLLPVPAYGFIVTTLALAAAGGILALAALGWGYRQARATSRPEKLAQAYNTAKFHLAKAWRQRWRIALSWTKAQLPDHLGIAVTATALAGIAGTAVFDGLAMRPSATSWVTTLAHTGQWLALAAAVALFGFTRQAFTDSSKRRQIGVLWDVGTFWPRASQPLAPPCYMERSVPETVNRLRRALGDSRRDSPDGHTDPAADNSEQAYIDTVLKPELGGAAGKILLRQDWVLLNGYSQGSPIAAAIIAQLPQELRDKMSLVTVGCPLRRLYGRAFPAYFGQRRLLELASMLSPAPGNQLRQPITGITQARARILPATRWRNLIRPSDYIGAYIFDDPMPNVARACDVDRCLLDPPRIIPADATTPPPIHEHSDYWPDPQTTIHTQELLTRNQLWKPHPAGQAASQGHPATGTWSGPAGSVGKR